MADADRGRQLVEQARLWGVANRATKDRRFPEARAALERALAIEKALFPAPAHARLVLTAGLWSAVTAQDPAAGGELVAEVVAIEAGFFGPPQGNPDGQARAPAAAAGRFDAALRARQAALGDKDRLASATLIDLALAHERAGDPARAAAEL